LFGYWNQHNTVQHKQLSTSYTSLPQIVIDKITGCTSYTVTSLPQIVIDIITGCTSYTVTSLPQIVIDKITGCTSQTDTLLYIIHGRVDTATNLQEMRCSRHLLNFLLCFGSCIAEVSFQVTGSNPSPHDLGLSQKKGMIW
jgi:hypothetical protein